MTSWHTVVGHFQDVSKGCQNNNNFHDGEGIWALRVSLSLSRIYVKHVLTRLVVPILYGSEKCNKLLQSESRLSVVFGPAVFMPSPVWKDSRLVDRYSCLVYFCSSFFTVHSRQSFSLIFWPLEGCISRIFVSGVYRYSNFKKIIPDLWKRHFLDPICL